MRRHPYMQDDLPALFNWVDGDYNRFLVYRHRNEELNRHYKHNGTQVGANYLDDLYNDVDDILDLPDERWRYYH